MSGSGGRWSEEESEKGRGRYALHHESIGAGFVMRFSWGLS
jgi:hypothetical protein